MLLLRKRIAVDNDTARTYRLQEIEEAFNA